ncbi:vesicle-associated membrane protein 724-like isoform X2 [Wolffia australiana]
MENAFIYSFVARGMTVLAEYTEFAGNFPAIALQCLRNLPSANCRLTYHCDHHGFNFLVQDGYAYCVVVKDSVGKQVAMAYLERLKEEFRKRYGGGRADTARAKSLNDEFGPIIKEHMVYVVGHSDELIKLLKVKAQVSEIKNIMLENVEKAVDRGQKLGDLTEKTTDLRAKAQDFKKTGGQVRRKIWIQTMKLKLCVLVFLLLLVLMVWVAVCQGFNCTK